MVHSIFCCNEIFLIHYSMCIFFVINRCMRYFYFISKNRAITSYIHLSMCLITFLRSIWPLEWIGRLWLRSRCGSRADSSLCGRVHGASSAWRTDSPSLCSPVWGPLSASSVLLVLPGVPIVPFLVNVVEFPLDLFAFSWFLVILSFLKVFLGHLDIFILWSLLIIFLLFAIFSLSSL